MKKVVIFRGSTGTVNNRREARALLREITPRTKMHNVVEAISIPHP